MNKRFIRMVATGHLVLDSCQGALPALAPFLVAKHSLSYAAAGGIVFAYNSLRPLPSHYSDTPPTTS